MAQKRILVPLDGSQFAEHAIPTALEIARRRDAAVEFLVVFEDEPAVAGWPLSPERAAGAFKEYLGDVAERLGKVTAGLELTTTVEGGQVQEHIVKHAGRWNTELVVMTTHGRGAVSRSWLGSVADHVVRHATVPVVLIRPVEGEEIDYAHRPAFQNVLVGLDGSKRAERCLEWATRIGGPDGNYTLLRVVTGPIHTPLSTYIPDAVKETSEILKKGRAKATEYLTGVADAMRSNGYTVKTEIVDGVPAATGILRYAGHNPTDLIAITTHGRTGISRLLMGSVADKVVRGADLPVLVDAG